MLSPQLDSKLLPREVQVVSSDFPMDTASYIATTYQALD